MGVAACSGASEVKPSAPPAPSAADPGREDPVIATARAALRGSGVDDAVWRSTTPAQWSDSSLGCPRKGISYMQVITDGHVVQFDSPNGPRTVHVAGENAVICSELLISGVPKRPNTAVRATTLEAMIKNAREDLASKLGVAVDDVKVVGALPFTWTGGAFRCGRPAAENESDTVTGHQLHLQTGGQSYVYFTNYKIVAACPAIETQ